MERELRRYQNLLVCVGSGIILFGFWSLVKGVMSMFLYRDEFEELLISLGTTEEELGFAVPFVYNVLTVLILIDLTLRVIVGSSAKKEGRGRAGKNQKAYLIFGVVLGIIVVCSLVGDISNFTENFDNLFDGIITIVIEVTSIAMIVELFVAGLKVKHLKKKIAEAKGEEAAA